MFIIQPLGRRLSRIKKNLGNSSRNEADGTIGRETSSVGSSLFDIYSAIVYVVLLQAVSGVSWDGPPGRRRLPAPGRLRLPARVNTRRHALRAPRSTRSAAQRPHHRQMGPQREAITETSSLTDRLVSTTDQYKIYHWRRTLTEEYPILTS